MKKLNKIAAILSVIAAVLMLVLLVTQFLPFWSVGDEEASISGYLWMSEHHKSVNQFFKDYFKTTLNGLKFSLNYFCSPALPIFISCVVGILLNIFKPGHFAAFILPAFGGISGTLGYLQNFLFQMGQNWQLHLVLCIVTAVVGCAGLAISAVRFFKPVEN